MNLTAGHTLSNASSTTGVLVTSPSLTSQTSSLLHGLLTVSSNNTGHPDSPVVPNGSNTPTVASSTSSLSPLTGSTTSAAPISDFTTSTSITTSSPVTTANVTTIFRNGTADSQSLIPGKLNPDHENYLMHGLLLQTALIIFMVALLIGVVYILRRKHLDRLRHHLMPVYNFDPADDGEDWETELLDDQFVHCPVTDTPQTMASGQLKLDTGLTRGLRVQNNNSSTISSSSGCPVKSESNSMSPTAMSGLLSSGSDSGSQNRRLYTSERDPVA